MDKGRELFYARFWSKVNVLKKNECWNWLSYVCPKGYGKISLNNLPLSAHVEAFKYFNHLETGLYIDHICMNKKCVNPNHLRAVTPKVSSTENTNGVAAKNARKTHCLNGHEFSGNNLIMLKSGARRCRTCYSAARKRARAALAMIDNGEKE